MVSRTNIPMGASRGGSMVDYGLLPGGISVLAIGAVVTFGGSFSGVFYKTFEDADVVGGDISGWDVSRGTNFRGMFVDASDFNPRIEAWDVSRAQDFARMFDGASDFNRDISCWNVSNVTDMWRTSAQTDTFNQDLSKWCVEKISSEPDGFDWRAYAWDLPQPEWGTCPAE